jgi:hypothetical protein
MIANSDEREWLCLNRDTVCALPSSAHSHGARRAHNSPHARSDSFAECVRRGLQTFTDTCQLARGKVDALLLHLRALVLVVSTMFVVISARGDRTELLFHCLDGTSEIGQMCSDADYVVFTRHVCWSLAGP